MDFGSRLSKDVQSMLVDLATAGKQSEILKALELTIRNFYNREIFLKANNKKTQYQALQELGLIGCFEGPKDLGENYENYLDGILDEKFD